MRTRHSARAVSSVVRARRSPRLGERIDRSTPGDEKTLVVVRVAAARGVLVREEAVVGSRGGDGRRADEQPREVCPAADGLEALGGLPNPRLKVPRKARRAGFFFFFFKGVSDHSKVPETH